MVMQHMNTRERVVYLTKSTGVLPAMKLKQKEDVVPWAQAMYEGGARVVEITMTSPGVLTAIEAIADQFGDKLYVAAGTVLDTAAARDAILAGASCIVSPALIPGVVQTAQRYGVACYPGAFTATECLAAIEVGADMVKIFPAALGGPSYMTNLRMVYPRVNLIPSGGISLENAGDFIKSGAAAISGARNFFDRTAVEREGTGWITKQVALYMQIVAEARASSEPLP